MTGTGHLTFLTTTLVRSAARQGWQPVERKLSQSVDWCRCEADLLSTGAMKCNSCDRLLVSAVNSEALCTSDSAPPRVEGSTSL